MEYVFETNIKANQSDAGFSTIGYNFIVNIIQIQWQVNI